MVAPDQHEITRVFRALSVEKRVEIVRLLSDRTLCVGALSNLVGISAGAVSQHLRVLRDAGLVEADRRGYYIHYSLTPDARKRCGAIMDSLFGEKEGGKRCAAGRRSAKGRRNSKAGRRNARRSR
jgi:DNA-binding transcriptional ArsR family regulator